MNDKKYCFNKNSDLMIYDDENGWILCEKNNSKHLITLLLTIIINDKLKENKLEYDITNKNFIELYIKIENYILLIRKNIYDETRLVYDEVFNLPNDIIELIKNTEVI